MGINQIFVIDGLCIVDLHWCWRFMPLWINGKVTKIFSFMDVTRSNYPKINCEKQNSVNTKHRNSNASEEWYVCISSNVSAQQILSLSMKYPKAKELYCLENKNNSSFLVVASNTVNRFRTPYQSKGKIYWQNCCWQVLDFVSETIQVSTT